MANDYTDDGFLNDLPLWADTEAQKILESTCAKHKVPVDAIAQLVGSLAQKARAAGIHLVLATQRPDAKTFVGLIRSNVPARIALTVQKSTESIIILDQPGAEDLLSAGDMLVKAKPGGAPERVHGVRIERTEIERYLKGR